MSDGKPFQSSATPPPQKPPPTVSGVLWQLANLIFKREAALVATSAVVLVGAGAGGAVWAQGRLDGGMDERVAPLEARQTKVEADVEQVKRQVANVERLGLETNLNVRLMLESRGIRPIDVPKVEPKDGGQ